MAAFGEAPQASPLVKAISAGELEQKATTQQVKALAEEERAQRIAAEAERERASEGNRQYINGQREAVRERLLLASDEGKLGHTTDPVVEAFCVGKGTSTDPINTAGSDDDE